MIAPNQYHVRYRPVRTTKSAETRSNNGRPRFRVASNPVRANANVTVSEVTRSPMPRPYRTMLMTPERYPLRPTDPRMTDVRNPMVQPIEAMAYTMPKRNMFQWVRLRCTETSGCATGGFHPRNIAIPMAMRAIPITKETYFAFCSMDLVKSREMRPTTRNKPTKPDETAVPTPIARRNVAALLSSLCNSVPR